MGLFFNRNKKPEETPEPPQIPKPDKPQNPQEVFFAELNRRRENDPLIGAVMGSQEVYGRLVNAVKEPDGKVNVNVLLLHLSALAGMSCQMACRRNIEPLMDIGTKDGRHYFMGDAVNKYLLEGQYSVWSLAAGIFHKIAPDRPVPDIKAMVTACVSDLGKPEHKVWGEVPEEELRVHTKKLWDGLDPTISRFTEKPEELPILYGLAMQKAIETAAAIISVDKATELGMECALLTAKMDYTKD